MIIGLTGTNGAGKTATADYLQSLGFVFHSLSDEIREELMRLGQEPTRENLIAMGNRLRREHGPGVLAERVRAKLRTDADYVIDSIRNPTEVEVLRSWPSFHLLHLDAPLAVRFERVVRRGGARLPKSLDEFVAQERRETESADPTHQQLRACHRLADETLSNSAALGDLHRSVDALLRQWRSGGDNPAAGKQQPGASVAP